MIVWSSACGVTTDNEGTCHTGEIKVAVLVSGGVAQGARASHPNVKLEVVDLDDCEAEGNDKEERGEQYEEDYQYPTY